MAIIKQWIILSLIFVLYWVAGYVYYKKCKSEVLIWRDIAKKERQKKLIEGVSFGICKVILALMAVGVVLYVLFILLLMFKYLLY